MALIRKSEIKKMTPKQLLEKKIELQKEMIKVNAQLSTKTTPENPGRIRIVKKTIAHINMILSQSRVEKSNHTEEVKKQKS